MGRIIVAAYLVFFCMGLHAGADPIDQRYENEWAFEVDSPGLPLSGTRNTGVGIPLAQFAAGAADSVFTTNLFSEANVLLCLIRDGAVGQTGFWDRGALLDADVDSSSGPVHYLRYDVQYDFSSEKSRGAFGVYFSNGAEERIGGVVLGVYDDQKILDEGPFGAPVTPVSSGLDYKGWVTAIAEIDLSVTPATLKVWYRVDRSLDFDHAVPASQTTLSKDDFQALRFHATGDVQSQGQDDYAAFHNIRHTVGAVPGGPAWNEIVEPRVDLTATPALEIDVRDSLAGAMDVGQTNHVSVVVRNPVVNGRGHPVTDVTSLLEFHGDPSALSILGEVFPEAFLRSGEAVTNIYQVVGHQQGSFDLYAQGLSTQVDSSPLTFRLNIGRLLNIQPVTPSDIVEVSGGQYDGLYEPGETLAITITTTNIGALAVSHELNTLVSPPGFTVSTKESRTYGDLNPGDSASTTYEVVIGADTDLGVYSFDVVNTGSGQTWTDSFDLEVSTRLPETDWVKADNPADLNEPISWVRGQVPDATDRARMDATVTAPITTALGGNLSWRGIALVSNTVDWTISGPGVLTVGSAGVDMIEAMGDLRIDSRLHLGSTQAWDVAETRTLDVTGIVTGMNTEPLVKRGRGTVRMSNPANTTLRGGVRVEEGTLVVANDDVLGQGDLMIGTAVLATSGDASLTNRLSLAGAATIANAHSLVLDGVIHGAGSLAKSGDGDLILGSENLFTGGVSITGGRIEIRHNRSLGTGPVKMHEGSRLYAGIASTFLSAPLTNPIELLGHVTFETLNIGDSAGLMVIDGNISGPGKMTIEGNEFYLQGDNTFSGGIDLDHGGWLRVRRNSLGTGPLTTLRPALLMTLESMEIDNDVFMDNTFRVHNENQDVVLSGNMSGSGLLQIVDSFFGSITITGDNSGRSGGTTLRRHPIRLGNRNALGSGEILLEPQLANFEINILREMTGANAMANNWMINRSYLDANTGERHPVRFNLDHDLELTGSITQRAEVSALPVQKEGAGALILGGNVHIPGPVKILSGSLVVNSTVECERITMVNGTVLSGTGTVGPVTLQSGSTLRLSNTMHFQRQPQIRPGAEIVVKIADMTSYGALVGTGIHALEMAGTLVVDFAGSTVSTGDEFQILRNWALLLDNGLQVVARNLPSTFVLDTSRLFTDGSVRLTGTEAPAPPPVEPGEIAKDANSDALHLASSWVGGRVPGAQDRARLDSRVSIPLDTPLGANSFWKGISLVSNVVDWTISGTQTLTLGSGGIDMSRANADLRIGSRLVPNANQHWDVAEGRILTMAGEVVSDETTGITKAGKGRLTFIPGPARQIAGELVVSRGTLAVSGGHKRLDPLRVEAGAPPVGPGRIRFLGGTTLTTAGSAAGLTNPITIQKRQDETGEELVDETMLRLNPGQDLLLAGSILGDGGLIHSGSGVVRLAGANSFSGGTLVDSGSTIEATHFRAFGQGPVTLRDGAALRGWLTDEETLPRDRTINNDIFLEGGQAVIENLADQNHQILFFPGRISGPGGLRVVMSAGSRRDVVLSGDNTFQGDLEIMKQRGDVVLFAAGPHSLGSGDIVSLLPDTRLGFNQVGGRVNNRINVERGSLNLVIHPNTTIDLAGEIYGAGSVSFVNYPGTIRLSGDNRYWSGGIFGMGSHNHANGIKRVIVEHPHALGTGQIVFGGQTFRRNYIEFHVRVPTKTRNNLFASHSGPKKDRNDLFVISRDSVFGRLDGEAAHHGLDKAGPGRMTLTAQGNYPSPFNVRAGSLELDGAGFPGKTTVFPGAGLIADDARTGPVRVRSGGGIEVKSGGLRVEGGALTLEGDARMVLHPGDPATALLFGDGTRALTLSGTLLVDFSTINPAPVADDFVELFGNWSRIVNDGVTILAAGLDDFMTLDTSTLFTDGRVRVVDGGRIGSQELSIRVTSGDTGSASVQVRNPENVTRYFHLKPGAGWPSWLSADPASARTAVGPGAQATIAVTANATGLPAGTHRFMLPVVWEHGVSDLIQVTVQVEGPSLGVAPGALNLPLVENTTGDGTVDLINNGTLPVSYRIRRVLAEHEAYTQPAADVPWITVSSTAQTEITSFASGRSAPRAIGFGFPFFGKTETEVSVGIDGTLWFDGKPAIRAFSNELSYRSGISKVTAKSEVDRFIVTWNRMVQPDSAQQTFQAVLHRDGRIDLRYDQIVADSAWGNALIGLHGPTRWFPAQVPDVLQGRTIRFARDAETARISIPQISGTVAAGTTQALTVTGDATGLSAGDSRMATFAIDYDGGLAGTAGEVAVTMTVHAPVPDPVGGELAPPVGAVIPPPVVVLNPPQRTADGGRHLSWSAHSGDGVSGYQPYGAEGRYRVQWTTNLASGIWADRATVTNEVEYTDAGEMPGPVIFYRIIKEK